MLKKLIVFNLIFMLSQSSFAIVKNTLFGEYFHGYIHKSFMLTNNEYNKWELINPIEDVNKPVYPVQATCFGNNCISLGYSQGDNEGSDKIAPVILTTQDGGMNWKQVRYVNGLHTKVSYLQGYFRRAICYKNRCFISGFTKDVAGNDKAYSYLVSEDGGSTWSIPDVDNKNALSALPRSDLYCIQNQCVSRVRSDKVFDSNNKILFSQDGGKSWNLTKPDIPESKEARIIDLQTTQHNFIAAGTYKSSDDKFHPLIMVSQDGGSNWQVKLDHIQVDNHEIDNLDNLACYKNTCLAATHEREKLVLLLSRDEGMSWQVLEVSGKMPDRAISMTLEKSICTDNACSIIGVFHLSRGSHPLLATVNSKEGENKYHLLSSELDADMRLRDIHCSNSICNIAGDIERDKKSRPILLESNNTMMSWNDISDKTYTFNRRDSIYISTMAVKN